MSLRDYQHRAIADLRAAYASGKRAPCLVMATGGGKTIVASDIISRSVSAGRTVLFLAHRDELIGQTARKLESVGIIDARVIRAGDDRGSRLSPVTVASIQTLTARGMRPPADLVVFDECHHAAADTWKQIADSYAQAWLLGLTATPQRSDGRPLGDIFDALVIGATARELTEFGHLVPCDVYGPPARLDPGQLTTSVPDALARHPGRAVIFCRDLAHAREVAASVDRCEVVHGGLASKRRRETLDRFQRGELRAVANVQVLTEGWDDPGCEVCVLARGTGHLGTFLQIVGRVLRPAPGKTRATLVDLCGSVHEHGLPGDDIEWSLDGKPRVTRTPIFQCPECGWTGAAPVECCPRCGFRPETVTGRGRGAIEVVGAGLDQITRVPPRPMRMRLLVSKYPGVCSMCLRHFAVGDPIAWAKGVKPSHEACYSRSLLGGVDAAMRGVA